MQDHGDLAGLIGSELAGYRIDGLITRGGMGVVYTAADVRLNRRVALKILAPEISANDDFRRRFIRESQMAAAIDHPNIIPIYGAGEQANLLWIAMRFVDGPSLRDLLKRRGHLALEETVSILSQVARALDTAHERGLIHRDVKPANILLSPGHGESAYHAYLSDFGLTKPQSEDSGIPTPGSSWGRSTTSRQSRSEAIPWTGGPTSIRWAACSSSA